MTEREPELNEPLRERLLTAARQLDDVFSPELETRIVAALQQEAMERARQRRFQRGSVAAGLAAAAALVLMWGARKQTEPVARMAQEGPLACPWVASAPRRFDVDESGTAVLELGAHGRVVLAEGARAEIVRLGGCDLAVRLGRGALAADLHDLKPGTLRVQTSLGDVVVHGTVFSVHLDASLDVVLLEGAVELVNDGAVQAALTPGKALHRAQPRAPLELRQASTADAQALRALLRGQARAPQAEPVPEARAEPAPVPLKERRKSSAELLAEAEAKRRAGALDQARDLYAAAALGQDANAEIALLRHVRLELDAGRGAQAGSLLAEHARRFARSALAAEAAWLGVRVQAVSGQRQAAEAAARALMARFPDTPQARAARRLLEEP